MTLHNIHLINNYFKWVHSINDSNN